MKIRQQIRCFGRVQGVGFRYTAKYAAQSFGITGWVYNDLDGSVLMEVQGSKDSIDAMLAKIENGIFIEIDRYEKNDLPLVTFEHSFQIKE